MSSESSKRESVDNQPKIVIRKVNNITVKPLPNTASRDTRPILGSELVPEIYSNVFLCAKKKSGKSVCIQQILKACCGPNTTIIAFCPTLGKDEAWIAIRKWAHRKGINFQGFMDIKEGKFDILESFVRKLEAEGEEDLSMPYSDEDPEEYEDERSRYQVGAIQKAPIKMFDKQPTRSDKYDESDGEPFSDEEQDTMDFFNSRPDSRAMGKDEQRLFNSRPKQSLKKRDKFRSAEFIFVFDDMTHALKCPSVVSLMKFNRHMRSLCLFSSQYILDLKPEQQKQLDLLMLFKGLTDDKLDRIIKACDLTIDLPTLKRIYDNATEEQYSFLWVDCRNGEFRKKFDQRYEIEA